MANNKLNKISGILDTETEGSELFGRSKTREEIQQERREAKLRQREEAKVRREAARAASKEELKKHRGDIIVLSSILAVIVVGCIVAFVFQAVQMREEQRFDRDESVSWFVNSSNRPELEPDRVTAAVQQVYYTKGGYLAVKMELGNGSDKLCHINSMYVEIRNRETKALIASGSSDQIASTYTIAAGEYNDYTFYITPELIAIKDDPLSGISYSISIDSDIND